MRSPSVVAAVAAASLALAGTVTAGAASAAPGGATRDPKRINALTAKAYTWGLAPEFVRRFAKYNSLINAPINQLKYGSTAAAWNTSGTNAGDASVLYLNSFVDFTKTDALVLTVPPSRKQYYVVNYLDNFINTVGSIGTRTTPSSKTTSYLLVGPESQYAGPQARHHQGLPVPGDGLGHQPELDAHPDPRRQPDRREQPRRRPRACSRT